MKYEGVVVQEENYGKCSGYANPVIVFMTDEGERIVLCEEWADDTIFEQFVGKRVKLSIEIVGEENGNKSM